MFLEAKSHQSGTWQMGVPAGTHSSWLAWGLNSTLALRLGSAGPVWEHHGMGTTAREQKMASAAGPDRQVLHPTHPALLFQFAFKNITRGALGKLTPPPA